MAICVETKDSSAPPIHHFHLVGIDERADHGPLALFRCMGPERVYRHRKSIDSDEMIETPIAWLLIKRGHYIGSYHAQWGARGEDPERLNLTANDIPFAMRKALYALLPDRETIVQARRLLQYTQDASGISDMRFLPARMVPIKAH